MQAFRPQSRAEVANFFYKEQNVNILGFAEQAYH